MSWDVSLEDKTGCVEVERNTEGGTYAIGGSTSADLNITYNYSREYAKVFDGAGFREWIEGRTGADAIKGLEIAINTLGTQRVSDYWAATPGNAGYALNILLGWARQYPAAVFHVC